MKFFTATSIHNTGQIYSCDESGMPLEHKLPCIISQKGAKKIRQITSGNKTQISILACANRYLHVRMQLARFYHPW